MISDSNVPGNNGVLATGAGPTPVVGPGATPASDLGSQIASAAQSKRLPFRVTATLGEVYDNNIFAQAHKESDFITRLSVRGEYQVGDLTVPDGNYFDMYYMPSLHVYERHSHETGVDQAVDAIYGHHWTKLTLTLEQIYTKTQETDASIGGLVTSDVYTTIGKAKFTYSPKVDVVLTGHQIFTNYDQPNYTDSKEWYGDLYGLYHVDPKLSVGFGPRIGYLDLEMSPAETYEQALGRILYSPNDQMRVEGAAGGEIREYQTVGRADTLEPIFEFSGIYLPNPSTTFNLNASRHFNPSL